MDLAVLRAVGAAAALTEQEREAARAAREFFEQQESGSVLESLGPTPKAPARLISREAVALIVDHEVGGAQLYEQRYQRPIWPGGASGVTIGVGYDLGHNTPEEIAADWADLLPEADIALLRSVSGETGDRARQALDGDARLRAVVVSWDAALEVFQRVTLPKFAARTARAFPNSETLHGHCLGALTSLVYNRGGSMGSPGDDRRREMRALRRICQEERFEEAPAQFRLMKRIWAGKGLSGLIKRREAEAALFEFGLAEMAR